MAGTQVRAGNLQDLVYKQGQAGVTKATVSITFDNSDPDRSPAGYEHCQKLTVTRQVRLPALDVETETAVELPQRWHPSHQTNQCCPCPSPQLLVNHTRDWMCAIRQSTVGGSCIVFKWAWGGLGWCRLSSVGATST